MQQDFSRLLFYLNTLYEFTHEMSKPKGLSEVLQRMLRIVIGTGIIKGVALIRQSGEATFEPVAQENLDASTLFELSQHLERGIADDLSHTNGLLELPSPPAATPVSLREVLARAGMTSLLVLRVQERLTVVVGLGPLLSGNFLASHQIELLEALAKHTEVALGNAILYQGLLQENQQLKKALDKRYQFDHIVGVLTNSDKSVADLAEANDQSYIFLGEQADA